MRKPMTIALIGCGRFCQSFVPLFCAHPNVKKVYVCDLISERAEDYSKRFGVEIIPTFHDALSSPEIDAVGIFTQRQLHGQMVIDALNAGKHVYSAVPCSISVDEIKEIERLVRKTGLLYSMGETGFYRAPTVFCRREFAKGTFGQFTYGEAQYHHDIRNMEASFQSSGGEDWKKYAGIPPMFYPTHSTAMILGSMPGVYAKTVTAFGFSKSERTDIYGTQGQNFYNNPFSNTTMVLTLSNGGVARLNEMRCIGWKAPETYITQFLGDKGGYEFSVANHHLATWDLARPGCVTMKDVTEELQPASIAGQIKTDYEGAIQAIADGAGFMDASPVQPLETLPKEFEGLHNGHNGTHHFLIDDFCRAYAEEKLTPTHIWQVARFNIPGLLAQESALLGGKTLDVPDLGDAPSDWAIIDPR